MSRLFTIAFDHNDNIQNAIVHVSFEGGIYKYDIRLKEIALFPNGRISWAGADGYRNLQQYRDGSANTLLDNLAGAINNYMARL